MRGAPARPAAATPVDRDVRAPESPRPTWRDKLRNAVDLAVAFATLADTDPSATPGPPAPVDVVHPHRTPLRPAPRPRRPGAAATRPQPCLSPVGRRPSTAPPRRTRLV